MRELTSARTYVTGDHSTACGAVLELAQWLEQQDERRLTVVSIEVDMCDEEATYYLTVTVESF